MEILIVYSEDVEKLKWSASDVLNEEFIDSRHLFPPTCADSNNDMHGGV